MRCANGESEHGAFRKLHQHRSSCLVFKKSFILKRLACKMWTGFALCSVACMHAIVRTQPEKTNVIRVGHSNLAQASTIARGLALVPPNQTERFTVEIEPGVYRERVWVNASLGPVTLTGLGDVPDDVLLIFHCCPNGDGSPRCSNGTVDAACLPQHAGAGMSRGVETLLIEADDFILSNMSVANDACGYDSKRAAQSETVQMLADRIFVTNVRLYGAQDTVYSGSDTNRQYLLRTYVNGSCDSIFGESSMVIEDCDIAITDHITAARSTPGKSMYLFLNSRLVRPSPGQFNHPAMDGRTDLGRAWGSGAHVLYKNCWMDKHIASVCVLRSVYP